MSKKIAVIGGGIVGSSASFYLAKAGHHVTLYDDGTGQATRAAAGIICPWLSQRRNQKWYQLTANGARFYQQLLADLQQLHINTDFYRKNGAVVFKKNAPLLAKLHDLAHKRRLEREEIGDLQMLDVDTLTHFMPEAHFDQPGLYASGGALVDGALMIDTLHQASRLFDWQYRQGSVSLAPLLPDYDAIILAVGAWLPELLAPFGLDVAVRAQKGQLFATTLSNKDTQDYPVLMPQGEIDLLPFPNGKWVIGATHENDKGYDLTPDPTLLAHMQKDASAYLPALATAPYEQIRVGTRAYTPDFAPFFGEVPTLPNVYAASGLGSSGLTSGAYIGYLLSQLVQQQPLPIDLADYPIDNYIKRT